MEVKSGFTVKEELHNLNERVERVVCSEPLGFCDLREEGRVRLQVMSSNLVLSEIRNENLKPDHLSKRGK